MKMEITTYCRLMPTSHDTTSSKTVKNKTPVHQKLCLCMRTAVVGCPELTPTDDTRMTRLGDGDVELACRSTDQKWRLTCVDNHWHGIVGNCTIRQ